jgi:hypothetical protein
MLHTLLAAVLLAGAASPAPAQPGFRDVKFTYGPFGPERESADFHRQDEVFLYYTIAGLRLNADGAFDLTLENKVTDPNGALVQHNSVPAKCKLLLGDSVPGFFTMALDFPYLPTGEWKVEITATDNVARRSASLTRTFHYLPPQLAVVRPGFFRDDQYKVPARLTAAVVGQPLFCRAKLVGFAKDHGNADVDVEFQFLDQEKCEEVATPFAMRFQKKLEEEPLPLESCDLNWNFTPNRAGDFRLRVVAHDRVSKKTAHLEVPLHIENP